jgi:hypothetical protein
MAWMSSVQFVQLHCPCFVWPPLSYQHQLAQRQQMKMQQMKMRRRVMMMVQIKEVITEYWAIHGHSESGRTESVLILLKLMSLWYQQNEQKHLILDCLHQYQRHVYLGVFLIVFLIALVFDVDIVIVILIVVVVHSEEELARQLREVVEAT